MKMKKKKDEINLFECTPKQLFSWEENEEELVVVNMPRFHVAWMQRYLVPSKKSPYIKITLDEFGTLAWKRIDGSTSLMTIADALVEEFGESVQPIEERLATFIRLLKERGFLSLTLPDGTLLK
jgi:Coenzyme PQQ synthesis protein D (PqqD)